MNQIARNKEMKNKSRSLIGIALLLGSDLAFARGGGGGGGGGGLGLIVGVVILVAIMISVFKK